MQTATIPQIQYQTKLETLEKELLKLKKESFGLAKKNISLKGIIKGVEISEEEIEQAKKSLFKKN